MGLLGVARAAWMMRYFGAENVRVLNGGLKKWEAEGRAVVENQDIQEVVCSDGDYDFVAAAGEDLCITDITEMHKVVEKFYKAEDCSSLDIQIVDARPQGAFDGGHIKGAICIPFPGLLNQDGSMKSCEDIIALYKAAGASTEKLTYNSCGIGLSACVNDLAQKLIGVK